MKIPEDHAESVRRETMEITWPPRFVRICKLAESPDPIAPAAAVAQHRYGAASCHESLPIRYSIEGWLLRAPLPGAPVRVLRVTRNSVAVPGIYASSEVVSIPSASEFTTLNSIYHWQEIESRSGGAESEP